MKNRVLRFFQRPEGVYHGSVFYQLSGGVGPSCLALDAQGSLYIGQFETRGIPRLHYPYTILHTATPPLHTPTAVQMNHLHSHIYSLSTSLSVTYLFLTPYRCPCNGRCSVRDIPRGQRGGHDTGRGPGNIRTSHQVSFFRSFFRNFSEVFPEVFEDSKLFFIPMSVNCTDRPWTF